MPQANGAFALGRSCFITQHMHGVIERATRHYSSSLHSTVWWHHSSATTRYKHCSYNLQLQFAFGQDVLNSRLQRFPLLLPAEAWDMRCCQGDGIVPAECC